MDQSARFFAKRHFLYEKREKQADTLIVLINFLPVRREHYRIGVPRPGTYVPLFQSEDQTYGGRAYRSTARSGRKESPGMMSQTAWS